MIIFKSFFNIFTVFFLVLSIVLLIISVSEMKEWKQLQTNGVLVEATIVDVIHDFESSDGNTYAYFEYSYKGKMYTFEEENYSDGLTVGKTISAYIYPDKPDKLIVYDGSTSFFFFWFMLVLALLSTLPGWVLVFKKFRHNA